MMQAILPSTETETPTSNLMSMRRYLDLLPLRPEFDETLQFLLLVKLIMNRAAITPTQLVRLLLEHRLTGLTVEHLAVKNHILTFPQALELLGERRKILDRVAGLPD